MSVTGVCDCGSYISIDACTALQEVAQVVCEQGTVVTYIRRGEPDVKRDSLNTVKSRSLNDRYQLKAYPVERQPNRKQLERAGIKEDVDTLVYVPLAFLIEVGLFRTPDNIEYSSLGEDLARIEMIRSTMVLDGSEWKIRDKGFSGRIGGIPLYVVFGLRQE